MLRPGEKQQKNKKGILRYRSKLNDKTHCFFRNISFDFQVLDLNIHHFANKVEITEYKQQI